MRVVWWHCRLSRHEPELTPGVSEVQGSQAGCSPWGRSRWRRLSDWQQQMVPEGDWWTTMDSLAGFALSCGINFVCRIPLKASSSVSHLLMSALELLHTVLYQHACIMHQAWFASWCAGKAEGCSRPAGSATPKPPGNDCSLQLQFCHSSNGTVIPWLFSPKLNI